MDSIKRASDFSGVKVVMDGEKSRRSSVAAKDKANVEVVTKKTVTVTRWEFYTFGLGRICN